MKTKIDITFLFLKMLDGQLYFQQQKTCRVIEKENPDLDGVLTNTKYNDKRKYPDDKLRKLISHFNSPSLRNSDLEKEDVFGDAFTIEIPFGYYPCFDLMPLEQLVVSA
jgi:type I restriction-modification system DNA methylase subunit